MSPFDNTIKWQNIGFSESTIIFFSRKATLKEKGRDLTQSYDKSPYTHRKIQKVS